MKNRKRQDIYFTSRAGPAHTSYTISPVFLGTNTGVGTQCVVLPGAVMEDLAFLGAGSVIPIKGLISRNHLVSGNPAVETGMRFRQQPQ
jgi:acetyltransferase-like isoleucine patch superfamily enzyme